MKIDGGETNLRGVRSSRSSGRIATTRGILLRRARTTSTGRTPAGHSTTAERAGIRKLQPATPSDLLEVRLRKFRANELAHRQRPTHRQIAYDALSRVVPQAIGYTGTIFLPYPYNLLAVAIFALATVSLLGSWFHDAVHGNTCAPRWVAVILQRLGSSPVGFSPHWWIYKHVRLHHRYPGDPELDPDIQFGSLGRVTNSQKWRPLHSTQHIHMWLLLPMSTLNMLKPAEPWLKRRYRNRHGLRATTPSWLFLLDKYVPAAIVWAPVFIARSFGSTIVMFLSFHLLAGTLVSFITQVQHNTTLSNTEGRECSDRWPLCNQLIQTSDVGHHAGLWWRLCGGVNFHVVHHIAPSLSFLELPAATSRLRADLADIGVELPTHTGMRAAISSHASLIYSLSRPNPASTNSSR
ncbi:fatty acid desaturase family protein [Micromonospora sp. DT229]|uniref:fatty acid desaturase family protein n=1 Tax=Micromonospora sp. DT229 TaxID=3393430 RepID=UPI003CF1862F